MSFFHIWNKSLYPLLQLRFIFMEFDSIKDSDLVFNFGPSIMEKCNTLILTFFMSNIDCVNDGNILVDIRSEKLKGKPRLVNG